MIDSFIALYLSDLLLGMLWMEMVECDVIVKRPAVRFTIDHTSSLL